MIELSAYLTGAEIAQLFDVTRQRVHKVLSRWKHFRPERVRRSKSNPPSSPVPQLHEVRDRVISFRLASRQVKRAHEVLSALGLRRGGSDNEACRAVLLAVLEWSRIAIDLEGCRPSREPKSVKDAAATPASNAKR